MLGESFLLGFQQFLTPLGLGFTFAGILIGLIIGVLPGLGPLMGIILLLPVATSFPPVPALGLLIAVFVGGSCGGSISAILLRIPGTPLAAATLLDGYPMAKKGRAGDAIGLAIAASAAGGLFGGFVLILLSPILAQFAANFAPPEFAALAVTGLLAIALVSEGSLLKGLIAGAFGLLLATIGTDGFSTGYRFTFGSANMLDGFHIVPIVVGLFALSEMAFQIMGKDLRKSPHVEVVMPGFGNILKLLKHWKNLLASSTIGAFFGALPGAGGVISSFAAYAAARTYSFDREEFGHGAEGGVIAPESANNATVGGTLIPTLALGIPGDAASAMLLGAILILGYIPGPILFEQQPEIVGGIFSVYLASNIFLLVIGIVATPLFVYVLRTPKSVLIPIVLVLCCLGTYSVQASVFDLFVMFGFGLIGILFRIYRYPLSPIVIGVILGPLLENNLRRSLLISQDGYWIFLERPVSAILIAANVLIVAAYVWASHRRSRLRKSAGAEADGRSA